MRTIGYSRIISLDSFKKPNFELVAEMLDWLASRFDPNAEIPSELETDKHRVNFMKAVCGLFTTKARIKISPFNLYRADCHAVPELIKIASLLHSVYTTQGTDAQYSSNFYYSTRSAISRFFIQCSNFHQNTPSNYQSNTTTELQKLSRVRSLT